MTVTLKRSLVWLDALLYYSCNSIVEKYPQLLLLATALENAQIFNGQAAANVGSTWTQYSCASFINFSQAALGCLLIIFAGLNNGIQICRSWGKLSTETRVQRGKSTVTPSFMHEREPFIPPDELYSTLSGCNIALYNQTVFLKSKYTMKIIIKNHFK